MSKKTRIETDTFGPIEVDATPLLWGAGAALARQLEIGSEKQSAR